MKARTCTFIETTNQKHTDHKQQQPPGAIGWNPAACTSHSGPESRLSTALLFLGCVWGTGQEAEPCPLLVLVSRTGKPELTASLGKDGGGCWAGGQLNKHNPIALPIAWIRLWNNIKPGLNKLLFPCACVHVSPVVQWHLFLWMWAQAVPSALQHIRVMTPRFSSYLDNAPTS